MQQETYHGRAARATLKPLVIVGNDVGIRVRAHLLDVRDGFAAEQASRQRFASRAIDRADRVLILANSGYITLPALSWCSENGTSMVCVGQDGHLKWTFLCGEGGAWRTRLRRAQSAAPWTPAGLEVARFLIHRQVTDRVVLLEEYAPRLREHRGPRSPDPLPQSVEMLRRLLPSAERSASVQQLRATESACAEAYWRAWVGLQPQFAPPSWKTPEQWKTFASRHSPISGGPKDAIDPTNATLNLATSLAVNECIVGSHAQGLDPSLAIVHSDADARPSLALDLVEALRPLAEKLVLDLILIRPFRRGDVWLLNDGRARLDQEFAGALCTQWVPILRRAAGPVVEHVVSILSRARLRPQEHPGRKVVPLPSTGSCPQCGSPVRRGRRFCSQACYATWWRANVQPRVSKEGNAMLARLRAEGRDPANTPEAKQKRVETYVRTRRRQALAGPPNAWDETDQTLQRALREVRERIGMPQLIQIFGLSPHTAKQLLDSRTYRAGPHIARQLAERSDEIIRSRISPDVPRRILERLRQAAEVVGIRVPRISTDERGRFVRG